VRGDAARRRLPLAEFRAACAHLRRSARNDAAARPLRRLLSLIVAHANPALAYLKFGHDVGAGR